MQCMKRLVAFFATMVLLYNVGIAVAKSNVDTLPHREYKEKHISPLLDKTLVEGMNKVVFAVTPEEKAKYIPTITWREVEQAAAEEVCTLSLVSAKGVDGGEVSRYLTGASKELRLNPGEAILVELKGPYWLTEVSIDTTGKIVMTITDETMVRDYGRITFCESDVFSFMSPALCNYLKIAAPETGGAVYLRGLCVKGKPTLGTQISREAGGDSVVLDAKDTSNPISVYRIPLQKKLYRLAESLLAGTGELSAHQKMMVFMDYIADFHVGSNIQYSRNLGLGGYIGACGDYCNLLAALARTQGFSARIISLANYPENTGHVVCEVFYEGAWHLYDPTFGGYYTKTPKDSKHPEVLGFEQLERGQGNDSSVTCIVTSSHRLISKMSYGFLGPRIYVESKPRGVLDPSIPLTYPLHLFFSSDNPTVLTQADFTTKYQGIQYIGVASLNHLHEWTLDGLEIGRRYEFVMIAQMVGGEMAENPFIAYAVSEDTHIIEGGEHHFENANENSKQWRISFVPETDKAHILLTHDYRGPELHYVWFASFELRKADEE